MVTPVRAPALGKIAAVVLVEVVEVLVVVRARVKVLVPVLVVVAH